jgi:4'-phosphopantetheinyl transferase
VWRASLESDPGTLGAFESTLTDDEISRANRFHFAHDRHHFIAARGILRKLLGSYVGGSPTELRFELGPQGKPALKRQDEPRICFNVSHSQGIAVFAFALDRELGVDVEQIRRERAVEDIAESFFSKRELEEFRALPQDLKAEGFFVCWTRKEAYVKAKGAGLQIPLDSFSVSLNPGSEKLYSDDNAKWSMHSFQLEPGYVGAVVAEGKRHELHWWNWSELH